jgi:bacterial/archaeal transporter family protein
MSLSIGIMAGLVAMLCWGVADFVQALNIKKIGAAKNMFFSNIIGFIPTLIVFFFFLAAGSIHIDTISFILLFVAGILDTAGVFSFMKSYEKGEISIVTPISASYSVLTVILAFLFLGETLPFLKIVSIVLIVIGIFFVSTNFKKIRHLHTVEGVKESIIALVAWGIYFFIIGLVSKRLLDFNMLNFGMSQFDAKISIAITLFFVTSLINGTLMIILSWFKGEIRDISALKVKNVLLFMIINFFLYTIAWIAVNYGVAMDLVSLVTPVSSLYPALTVMLALVFLKEKLVFNQKIGVVIVLLGIVLISL